MVFVGIDPGSTGASMVTNENRFLFCVVWKPVVRKKRKVFKVSISWPQRDDVEEFIVPTMVHVGDVVCRTLRQQGIEQPMFGVEDAYVGPNPRTAIYGARSSAFVIAPFLLAYEPTIDWCSPSKWRRAVFGNAKRRTREGWKRYSLQEMPKIIRNWNRLHPSFQDIDHVADAAGIAAWLHKTNQTDGATDNDKTAGID